MTAPVGGAAPASPPSRRARLLQTLRVTVAVVVLAAVVYAVARNWADVSGYLGQVSWPVLLASTLAAAVGTWLTGLGWKVLLRELGSDLHVAPASGVYFVGQLGKYLPGSLWSVLVQADMAARLGVPRRRTAVAGLLALGFALLTGGLVGLPAAALLLREHWGGSSWWVLLAVPVALVLLVPRVLNRAIALGLRTLRREPLEHELSPRAVLVPVVVFLGVWACFGVHTLLLARAVAGDAPHPDLTVAALTGYALSVSVGMLTIILPAGLGAREGLMTLALATAVPAPAAAAVAILSRFIVTVVDVLAAALGWAYARSHDLVDDARPAADPDPGSEPEAEPEAGSDDPADVSGARGRRRG
ncbi:lysylphosphatidylglycerol synthase transmembrane domain-containing protein [Terracoccus luteus]|uniref:Lysylphosphatidylglycerol synthase-like protein n=1 Tax=Terracoccus luteus TaxID=53356 RepID=A0A839PSL7_9MICO|nr:lysylphosphatidylglycerol synthase transmembrane domain-containing protein [Terracoccus luteus]MBB2985774.1 hypothetical protein [Terracoccus luteus]MCP2171426.1 hypothetical protein [Terracoccus luteus]